MRTPTLAESGIARREFLTLVGAASTGVAAASTALAQISPTPGTNPSEQKSTVALDRPGSGVLLIGIERPDAQNRIDVATFNALGQAYYEFEHDDELRVAVSMGAAPTFHTDSIFNHGARRLPPGSSSSRLNFSIRSAPLDRCGQNRLSSRCKDQSCHIR